MPAYKRDKAASLAAALKSGNVREPQPRSLWVLSVKDVLAPNIWLKTLAAALDWTEWPEGYSGNGGVVIKMGTQLLSNAPCT